jgi:hypothetical protein
MVIYGLSYGELRGCGATLKQGVTAQPWGLRHSRVLDCDGNELQFTEAA